jgi:hypothetical protein
LPRLRDELNTICGVRFAKLQFIAKEKRGQILILDFNKVAGTSIDFITKSYSELWEAWSKEPSLADHASQLKERYCVKI